MTTVTKTEQLLNASIELAARDGAKFAIATRHDDLIETEEGTDVVTIFKIRYFLGEGQMSHFEQEFGGAAECVTEMKTYNASAGLRSWRPVSYGDEIMTTAKKTVSQKINEIVKAYHDENDEGVSVRPTQRRHGARGFGYYTVMDVAYEGQRVFFCKSLKEAQEHYAAQ